MGQQRVVDQTIRGLQTLTSVTPSQVTGGVPINQLGYLPLGNYKGALAFFDLNKLANEPLVQAELLHILGVLDGREEDYDLQTITIPNLTQINASVRERLTVPTGQVWYVTAIQLFTPADVGGTPAINWRYLPWTDRALAPDVDGQSYHLAPLSNTPVGFTWYDEFWPGAPAVGGPEPGAPPTNKAVALRLPAGTIITFVATNLTAVATGAMACTGRLYGYIGKQLVD